MVDFSGGLPDGIFSSILAVNKSEEQFVKPFIPVGNTAALGSFESCLEIDVPSRNFSGLYSLIKLKAYNRTQPGNVSPISERNRNSQKITLLLSVQKTEVQIVNLLLTTMNFHWGICIPSSCSPRQVFGPINEILRILPFVGKDVSIQLEPATGLTYTKESQKVIYSTGTILYL